MPSTGSKAPFQKFNWKRSLKMKGEKLSLFWSVGFCQKVRIRRISGKVCWLVCLIAKSMDLTGKVRLSPICLVLWEEPSGILSSAKKPSKTSSLTILSTTLSRLPKNQVNISLILLTISFPINLSTLSATLWVQSWLSNSSKLQSNWTKVKIFKKLFCWAVLAISKNTTKSWAKPNFPWSLPTCTLTTILFWKSYLKDAEKEFSQSDWSNLWNHSFTQLITPTYQALSRVIFSICSSSERSLTC